MSFSNAKGDDSHGYWPSDHDVLLGLRSERPMLCVLVQRNRPRLIVYSAASRMALLTFSPAASMSARIFRTSASSA